MAIVILIMVGNLIFLIAFKKLINPIPSRTIRQHALLRGVAYAGILVILLAGFLLYMEPAGANGEESTLSGKELAALADDPEPNTDKSFAEKTGDLLSTEPDYPILPEDSIFDKTLYILEDADGKRLITIKLGKGGIKSRFLIIAPENAGDIPVYLDLRGPFISGGRGQSGGQGIKVIIRF